VFKLDQEEYVREGIDWKFIDYSDNQPCIDLIESKLGILDLLDEECRMPNGSDSTWIIKLNNKCKHYKNFQTPKINSDTSFNIIHFADNVNYHSNGFIEKNRDSMPRELLNTIHCSKVIVLKG